MRWSSAAGSGLEKPRGKKVTCASAVVIQDSSGRKIALVACDVLMINRDVLDRSAKRVEQATGIPFNHILINATHTHHAPSTVTVHGYRRDEAFTKQVGDKIVEATIKANGRLNPASFSFRLGEESSVGKNSRLLLSDGTIYWIGTRDDALRPTGPFDPELPVLAFRRQDGGLEAVLFNHSTHTIGTHKPGVRSPSFYGLAAQALEKEKGGTFLFFEGASGSTHNLDVLATEATVRIQQAVERALESGSTPIGRQSATDCGKRSRSASVTLMRRPRNVPSRPIAHKRIKDPASAKSTIETFRAMRKRLAPLQGQERKTWVQVILIGDVAIVGVPGEFFTVLGQEIKRALAVPLYVRLRAGQRLHRLHSRPAGFRSRGLSSLDRTAQFSRTWNRREDRRSRCRIAGSAAP